MEVVLDEVWNRLSALFGGIFTTQYHHTCVVLKHSLFWLCTSQGPQLKYRMYGSSLLFYLFFWFFFLLPFPLYLLFMHNSLSNILRLSLLPQMTSRVFAEQFAPSDDGAHIIDSGTVVPPERDSPLGINPVVIGDSVSLGHPRVVQPIFCRSTFWDEGEWCRNNTQQALPIQQSITHFLLVYVCMFIWFIAELILFNYLSVLSRDNTVPAPLFSKMAMNHDLWPKVVCAPNTEQHCHYPILK